MAKDEKLSAELEAMQKRWEETSQTLHEAMMGITACASMMAAGEARLEDEDPDTRESARAAVKVGAQEFRVIVATMGIDIEWMSGKGFDNA